MRHRFLLATIATVVATLLPADAHAAVSCTRYASPTGKDAAAGTAAFPWRTVQKLVDATPAGGTGCLNAGTYTDGGAMYVARITRDDITIASTPGQRATVKGVVYVVNGADRVTISDLNLDGRPSPGVQVQNSPQILATDTTLARLNVTNGSTVICAALGDLNGYGRAIRTTIRDSTFTNCGSTAHGNHDHAIYLDATTGARILRNTFVNSAAYAIHLYPDAQSSLVQDNVMRDNGGGIIFAGEGSFASSNNVVERNSVIGSKRYPAIHSWWGGARGTGNLARSNCLQGNLAGNVDTTNGGFTSTGNVVGTCSTAPSAEPTPTPIATPTATPTPSATPTTTPTPTPTCG